MVYNMIQRSGIPQDVLEIAASDTVVDQNIIKQPLIRKCKQMGNIEEAEKYFEEGYDYAENSEYSKAIESFTKAIDLKPEYADVYYTRSLAYSETGEHEKAKADHTKAAELDPKYA